MRRISRFVHAGAALLVTALALPSCQSDVEGRVALAGLSSGCRINSDCGELLVCVFERCHQECTSSRDCERGSRCMRTEQGRNVCQLPDESACSDEQGCPGTQVCGPDAECRDGCRSDDECVSEQVCRQATCADPVELGPEGALPPAPEPPATPVPCAFDSDCPLPLVCSAGSCRPECAGDDDCAPGERCAGADCVPLAIPGACLRNSDCEVGDVCEAGRCEASAAMPECDYDSDCSVAGQRCLAERCRCECATDADCGPSQACEGECQCVPNRVIYGDVTVSNERELAVLADVVEVTGQLSVDSYRSGTLRFPRLRKANRVAVSGINATVEFEALEEVTEAFYCHQDCRAEALRIVGDFTISTPAVRELKLPALETAGVFWLKDSPYVTALRLPRLTTAKELMLQNVAGLVTVEAPLLRALESLNVSGTKRLRRLSLPLAEPTVNLFVSSSPGIESVSLPRAQALSGKLYLYDTPQLRSLDLRQLASIGQIELRELARLTDLNLASLERVPSGAQFAHITSPLALSLPALMSAGPFTFTGSSLATSFSAPNVTELGNLELSGLQGLQTLDLSKLSRAGTVYITATGLTHLDTLDQSRAGSLSVTSGDVSIVGNPALPVCVVSSLRASLSDGLGGELFNQNNCSCAGTFCP
ncbi:MAG: uncharacterized protein K0R38_4567 [Polyangiaceae bacterium]|jgi:hypothetical protein|nr:uncharacterized protein [Polyangiaceae bacterium]